MHTPTDLDVWLDPMFISVNLKPCATWRLPTWMGRPTSSYDRSVPSNDCQPQAQTDPCYGRSASLDGMTNVMLTEISIVMGLKTHGWGTPWWETTCTTLCKAHKVHLCFLMCVCKCVCVCVCVREREREREISILTGLKTHGWGPPWWETTSATLCKACEAHLCFGVCVCVWEREEDREKDRRQKGEEGYMLLPESVFKPELSAIPDHTLHISVKH